MRIRATNNTITKNIFENNQEGLYVCCDSENITIFNNDFINNSLYQAKGNYHNNRWYKDNITGGNYWSNYTGTDDNNDGIGDTPYLILSREQNGSMEIITDTYPLINPFIFDSIHIISKIKLLF